MDSPQQLSPPWRAVLDALYDAYGRPAPFEPDDILGVLIETILSQSTTNINASRAFQRLMDAFEGDWQRVHHAPTEEVVDAIRSGGLAKQKAPRIQAILGEVVRAHGVYSLEALRAWPVARAYGALRAYPGVGPKSAAFTLLCAAQAPLFAMDTHILRLCRRLGWVQSGVTDARAHELMAPHVPEGEHASAHIVMIDHGRTICHARQPRCDACPLLTCCPRIGVTTTHHP